LLWGTCFLLGKKIQESIENSNKKIAVTAEKGASKSYPFEDY
jgi:hypothetical protein